ncbi:hypothetical protein BC777_1107 [Yoonia maricola]|uniref:TM2 domain-containing protein n=1 Tax=Yoonia maricola TaxID=420999 RepID=A0A2M8WMU8_9RHOB|nr:hypothetical protein [Yoonia maricola]PJI92262.1 hypothetical protein BC777_1107 [Yoonia maricola]
MQVADRHPKLWIAYLLALLSGQTGLYHLYLGRAGSAVIMTGAIIFVIAISLAAPSQLTGLIVIVVFIALTVIWIFDLVRMKGFVTSAHHAKLQKGSI